MLHEQLISALPAMTTLRYSGHVRELTGLLIASDGPAAAMGDFCEIRSLTRTIRAQVLSMRERSFVQVAKLSGMSGPEIIVKEMLPNLFPYLAAALVNSVSAAVLASVGLEVLGLGPIESPTIGMTIYWVLYNAALINGWWWWWAAPIAVLAILFIGLFAISVGMDEIANPRLRRTV